MKKTFLLLAMLFLLSPENAKAGGVRYLNFCSLLDAAPHTLTTSVKAVTISCVAFITGVMETHKAMVLNKKIKPLYCKSPRITYGDVAKMYNKYAKKHQAKPMFSEAEHLLGALGKNYPCK